MVSEIKSLLLSEQGRGGALKGFRVIKPFRKRTGLSRTGHVDMSW